MGNACARKHVNEMRVHAYMCTLGRSVCDGTVRVYEVVRHETGGTNEKLITNFSDFVLDKASTHFTVESPRKTKTKEIIKFIVDY